MSTIPPEVSSLIASTVRATGPATAFATADTPRRLADLATAVAAMEPVWRPFVRHDPLRRWYLRLHWSPHVDVWLLTWVAGQDTTVHDHGGACGAFCVVEGVLWEEYGHAGRLSDGLARREHAAGQAVGFGATHVHDLGNRGPGAATSVHAYAPPLSLMGFYEYGADGRLAPARTMVVERLEAGVSLPGGQATAVN